MDKKTRNQDRGTARDNGAVQVNGIEKRIFEMQAQEVAAQIKMLCKALNAQGISGDIHITIREDGTFEFENTAVPGMVYRG